MNQTLPARLRDVFDHAANCDTVPDEIWEEHGWALGVRGVTGVIVAVLVASVLLQLIG